MKANRVAYTTVTLSDKEIGLLIQENKDALTEGGRPVTRQLLNSLSSGEETAE